MGKKWKRFENLSAQIQRSLSPSAVVTQNERVRGKITGVKRELDIVVRVSSGQFELLIVIDCKDYNKKVDVQDVESFMGKLKDVEANKGALVAAKGYTDAAKKMAKDAGISVYDLVDAESEDWPSYVTIPVLVDGRHLQSVSYQIASTERFSPSIEGIEYVSVFRSDGSRIGPLRDLLSKRWNDSKLPIEPGLHESLPISDEPTYMLDGKRFVPVNLAADIMVKKTLYFGHLPLIKVQGFRDAISGDLHTRSMTTDWMNVETVRREWKVIPSEEALAVTPMMVSQELTYFPLEGEAEINL
ncbi:MAG: restriction endonuclease [Desulfobacterales bacterium]